MNKYYCDLHIHSCLSPCGDDEMTPANIAGMAVVNGLNIVALTDHNSSKNCPAFFKQAKKLGIIPVAGMELTTAEDVHVVCLFRELEDAMEFDRFIEERRPKIKNKPEIFGNQHILDENDQIIGEEDDLLLNAAFLSIEEAFHEVLGRGGVCYPAHIDRPSNGIIAMLGTFPEEDPVFTAYELNDGDSDAEYREKYPVIQNLARAVSSDAHYLWDIRDKDRALELEAAPDDPDEVRRCLIDRLRRGL